MRTTPAWGGSRLRSVFDPPGRVGEDRSSKSAGVWYGRLTMFTAAKDMMTSKAAKSYANDYIKRYGRVDDLTIDSKRCRIDVTCTLNGEVSQIAVTIAKYTIVEEDGKTFLEVLDSSSSRLWLQTVMRDHLHGKKIPLPGWAKAAL